MYVEVSNNTTNLNVARNCKYRGIKERKKGSIKSITKVEVLYLILGTLSVLFIEQKR